MTDVAHEARRLKAIDLTPFEHDRPSYGRSHPLIHEREILITKLDQLRKLRRDIPKVAQRRDAATGPKREQLNVRLREMRSDVRELERDLPGQIENFTMRAENELRVRAFEDTKLHGEGAMQAIAGKTVRSATRDMYGERVTITFTDGTVCQMQAGSDSIHNDRWNTVVPAVWNEADRPE